MVVRISSSHTWLTYAQDDAIACTSWALGFVSLKFGELSKIISRKYTVPEITFMMRISSWNFVCVAKAGLWPHIQSFNLKFSSEVKYLQYRNFERISWRARETLVKQPPDVIVTLSVGSEIGFLNHLNHQLTCVRWISSIAGSQWSRRQVPPPPTPLPKFQCIKDWGHSCYWFWLLTNQMHSSKLTKCCDQLTDIFHQLLHRVISDAARLLWLPIPSHIYCHSPEINTSCVTVSHFHSLIPGRCGPNFRQVSFKHISMA